MKIINFIKKLFSNAPSQQATTTIQTKSNIYQENEEVIEDKIEIISIWDVLDSQEHTQAHHLISVIPFDEWVSMDEIRRRIWDIFQIEYQNDRSLYPYLKTMVDLGLIETSNIGGRRKWRKKDLLIKKNEKKKEKLKIEEQLLHV